MDRSLLWVSFLKRDLWTKKETHKRDVWILNSPWEQAVRWYSRYFFFLLMWVCLSCVSFVSKSVHKRVCELSMSLFWKYERLFVHRIFSEEITPDWQVSFQKRDPQKRPVDLKRDPQNQESLENTSDSLCIRFFSSLPLSLSFFLSLSLSLSHSLTPSLSHTVSLSHTLSLTITLSPILPHFAHESQWENGRESNSERE